VARRDDEDDRRGGGGGFKYRGRSADTVHKLATQQGGSYDSFIVDRFQTLKVKEGEHTFRILPYTWDDTKKWGDHWAVEIFVHGNVGPENNQYLCLRKMLGKHCPVCEKQRELEKAGEDDDAKEIRIQNKWVCWAIDRDNEKAGPLVWSVPFTLNRELCLRSEDKRSGSVLLIDDPEEGYDVSFIRDGSGLKTRYNRVDVARESSPLSESVKQRKAWLEFVNENPVPEVLNYYQAEYIDNVLNGNQEETDKDLDRKASRSRDDDEPRGRSARGRDEDEVEEETKPRSAKRSRDEDEESPPKSSRRSRVSDDNDDDEKSDEGRPSRNGRRVAADDPEDEPEEKPRAGKRARDSDEEEETKPRATKRERLTDQDDEEEAPRSGRRARETSEEDDEPVEDQARAKLKDLGKRRR
jgi:hypothetical protein